MSDRLRNFCWVVNNWTDDDVAHVINFHNMYCTYTIFGYEVGEKKGTPHLQGYSVMEKQMRFSSLKKNFVKGAHLGKRKGTHKQAAEYCKKDGNFQEFGTPPQQGQRTDLEGFVEATKENPMMSNREIIETFPRIFAMYPKFVDTVRSEYRQLEDLKELDNHWIWGPAGAGKSRFVRDKYKESLFVKGTNKWWDGYNDEDTVLIEDIDPENCQYLTRYLKIWSDYYVLQVEVKNGGRKVRPKRICITSNYSPAQCFNRTDLPAIERRFQITFKSALA